MLDTDISEVATIFVTIINRDDHQIFHPLGEEDIPKAIELLRKYRSKLRADAREVYRVHALPFNYQEAIRVFSCDLCMSDEPGYCENECVFQNIVTVLCSNCSKSVYFAVKWNDVPSTYVCPHCLESVRKQYYTVHPS